MNREGREVTTDIPARLDRLPWSRWHVLVVVSLGITWLLDGLEGNLASALAGILERPETLALTDADFGLSGSLYLFGSVTGALVFGYATDRLGRKKLFSFTLLLYLSATLATAFSWNFASYAFFRALTGAGIGGEYAAINSAVDELIPSRVRGHVDLLVNATFWIGAGLGSGASIWLLGTTLVSPDFAWRFAFGIGAVIGLGVLALRHYVPESPRWLMVHGRVEEAEAIVTEIERHVAPDPATLPPPSGPKLRLRVMGATPWRAIWRAMAHDHRKRSILGFTLMVTQAFFYNAVLFTYGLVLLRYYHVPAPRLGLHLVPLAAGNFLGPLVMGRFFDTIGRKTMISGTYILSGILLAATAWLFRDGRLTLTGLSVAWMVTFFVASSAASSAYLTVSETFPPRDPRDGHRRLLHVRDLRGWGLRASALRVHRGHGIARASLLRVPCRRLGDGDWRCHRGDPRCGRGAQVSRGDRRAAFEPGRGVVAAFTPVV
jgi:MFS family permease